MLLSMLVVASAPTAAQRAPLPPDYRLASQQDWTLPVAAADGARDVGASDTTQRKDNVPHRDTTLTANARRVLEAEVLQQRRAWQELERREHPTLTPLFRDAEPMARRSAQYACNADSVFLDFKSQKEGRGYGVKNRVASSNATLGVCPAWIPPRRPGRHGNTHEYLGRNPTAAQLVPFSDTLIALLRSAAKVATTDSFAISQLTRVLVENGAHHEARRALADCSAFGAWCRMLQIHVEQEAGAYRTADSLVRALIASTPVQSRCRVFTALHLFPPAEVDALGPLDCAARDSLSRVVWWLGQPFFSDSVNVRRSEHVSRLIRNTLAEQLGFDAHYSRTVPREGGDALELVRQRYGWADHQAWVGSGEEKRVAIFRLTPPPPYSAPEYAWPRSATFPPLRLAGNPYALADGDVALTPPDSVSHHDWWPREFMQHKDGVILPLARQQRVLLPRDAGSALYVASTLKSGARTTLLDSIGALPVHTSLWLSPFADSVMLAAKASSTIGGTTILHTEIRSPAIVGVEYRVNEKGLAGGRTRFGIGRVPSLQALGGACAISPPMLVDPAFLNTAARVPLERALLGSLSLENPTTLGIVWESYGVLPNDSTTISLRVDSRQAVLSGLQRAMISVGLKDDPTVAVGVMWTEPNPNQVRIPLSVRVSTFQRQLALQVDRLRAGEYTLTITMENERCGLKSSDLAFRVVR